MVAESKAPDLREAEESTANGARRPLGTGGKKARKVPWQFLNERTVELP